MSDGGSSRGGTFRRLGRPLAGWLPSGRPTAPADLGLRLALALALAAATVVLFPPRGGVEVPLVRTGTVAPEDVIAPFDFRVPWSEEELARRRERARLAVPPVFAARAGVADSAVARVEGWLERVAAAPGDSSPGAPRPTAARDIELDDQDEEALTDPAVRQEILAFARRAVPALYADLWLLPSDELDNLTGPQITVRETDGEERVVARSEVVRLGVDERIPGFERRTRQLDPQIAELAQRIVPPLLLPDLTPLPAATAVRSDEAAAAVDRYKGEVLAGELIVGAHSRVTAEQEEKIRALLATLQAERGGFTAENARVALGALFLHTVLLLLYGFFLFLYRRDVFDDVRSLLVVTLVWGLVIGAAAFVDRAESVPPYAIPVALGAVLIAVLWDSRLAAVTTLFLSIYLVSLGDLGTTVLWTGLFGGLAGAWSVRRIRRRTHFYESLLFIGTGHALAILALALVRLWSWGQLGTGIGWGFLSAALAVFVAMGLLPLLEWASGRTTDLTLLELADLNRPLLKRLLLECPGSYHHSIIVGNLAEAAAEGIGANSLLARVGAYYHDIGKIERPEYFAENQRQGVNPHDALDPEASASLVARHVDDGVELARRNGLPDVVIDFIREHHGTTVLTYFWHKARERGGPEPEESGFRYPGPRPRSRETAVVMLADSVEAASRVVPDPSPERFREAVRRIVEMKLEEHQLDRTGLTFRDLALVEEKFVAVLTGIHHHRIEYPTIPLHPRDVRDAPPSDSISSVGRAPR